jgi:hypothetical protein
MKKVAFAVVLGWMAWLPNWAFAQLPNGQPPPIRSAIDANQVDLTAGRIMFSTTDVVIGRPGQGGLTFARSYYFNGWRNNHVGAITSSGTTYTVSIGGRSESFTLSAGTYNPAQGQGSALTFSSGTQLYTYTSSVGDVAVFDKTITAVNNIVANEGFIKTLTSASGEKATYNYVSTTVCAPPSCSPSATIRRLQSVTNNLGYQLRFIYAVDGTTIPFELSSLWLRLTSVRGINMAVDYCNPTAQSCPAFTQTWPTVSYGYPSSTVETVTNAAGGVTTYTPDRYPPTRGRLGLLHSYL